MKLSLNKLEAPVFYTLLILFLIPIWAVDFFVTADGPCHLYNSKILLDWWQGVNRIFYDPHYYLSTYFDPNWLFNLITAPLLGMFGPDWAEKIYFTLYVAGFGLGFRFLITEINPKAKFISSLGILFCYHKLLMVGFLNNAMSFALWFWVAGWWWRKRNDFSHGWLIIQACFFLLIFATHPTGLIFCMLMIVSMIIGLFIYEEKNLGKTEGRDLLEKRIKSLLLSALPTGILLIEFILRSDLSPDYTLPHIKNRLQNIGSLSSLISMDSGEVFFAQATAFICGLIVIGGCILRLRDRRWLLADGLFIFFILASVIILWPPNSLSGGLDISLRLALIPFIALLYWVATANFPLWSQSMALLCALMLGIGFLFVRLPIHQEASDYASEIYSCNTFIQDTSTLLVLNYDWTGQTTDGKKIADRTWLFTHVDCYLGIDKSLVISDNYEAHFPYFPIRARWQTHMYGQTDKDQINFDHRPPRADILNYKRRTKQDLDYVLMISYREEFKSHPYTQEIFSQLEQGYNQVFSSEHRRAILYKRKDLNVE